MCNEQIHYRNENMAKTKEDHILIFFRQIFGG